MAFRWPSVFHDIALATEVARDRPEKPCEGDKIAESLSQLFSTEKTVTLKGKRVPRKDGQDTNKVQGRRCQIPEEVGTIFNFKKDSSVFSLVKTLL